MADGPFAAGLATLAEHRAAAAPLLLLALLVRLLVGLHPYSGEATPPMFGDYEAQVSPSRRCAAPCDDP